MPGRLILVRHGESEGNAQRRFTRTPDSRLTARGAAQAERAAERIQQLFAPVRLVTSPYTRARQTAEIIAQRIDLPIETESDLREQFLGLLHGEPYESALSSPGFEELSRGEWRPPDGETLLEVQARALPVIRALAARSPASDVVAVCHAGTIHSIWAHSAGGWESTSGISNAGILVIPHDGQRLGPPELLCDDGR